MDSRFDIPVLLIIFNRPDTALEVVRGIKMIKPKKLYIAADGPRIGNHKDVELCKETRETVLNQIDWECDIKTLFRDENVGCGVGPASSISWMFENEEMGIILEDDVVPGKFFFNYCRELLLYYKDNKSIMHISGFNDQDNLIRGKSSYFFTHYPCEWGWATWKRAWNHHSLKPVDIDKNFEKTLVYGPFQNNRRAAEIYLKLLYYNIESAWDYQWAYAIWRNNGISISPNISLVKNIGFDERATHTTSFIEGYSNVQIGTMGKIIHPVNVVPDHEADKFTIGRKYYKPFLQRLLARMKKSVLSINN
jgi:hypothetical protein